MEGMKNMFTNNKDFYPTPEAIINKMLCDIDFKMIHSILEPSAGSGNIIEAIKKKEKFYSTPYNKFSYDIDCIEEDPVSYTHLDFCWEIHRSCYRTTYRLEVVGLGRGKVVIFVGGG